MAQVVNVVRSGPDPETPSGGSEATSRRTALSMVVSASPYAVLGAFVLAIIVFSVLEPDSFATWNNARSIITQASVPITVGIGLTMCLIVGQLDLSFAATIGLGGALAVSLMAESDLPWPVAILLALLAGAAIGLVNGTLVAYLGGPAIIITLATASAIRGLEFVVTDQRAIFSGLDPSYVEIGRERFFGLPWMAWIALSLALVAAVVMRYTQLGRYMYAVGANTEAARLAGVRIKLLRLIAFVVIGVGAAVAGILLTAQASSSYPDSGEPYLLPTFAAVFLGAAAVGRGRFTILGTVFGVLFFQVVRTGLTILNLETWIILVFEGALLVMAALLSLLAGKQSSRQVGAFH